MAKNRLYRDRVRLSVVKDTSGKEVEGERKDLSGEDGIKIVK